MTQNLCTCLKSDPPKVDELARNGFSLFKDAYNAVQKGEFKGVPLLGKTSLWSHYGGIPYSSLYDKMAEFCQSIVDGFKKRFKTTSNDDLLVAGQKFLIA